MNAVPVQQAYNETVAHMNKLGRYEDWYAGIASDWDTRLFSDHRVPRQGAGYIVRKCHNDKDSTAVEDALRKLGCDGGGIVGNKETVYVYAYLKTSETDP
jgi:hypothetical protein